MFCNSFGGARVRCWNRWWLGVRSDLGLVHYGSLLWLVPHLGVGFGRGLSFNRRLG